MDFRGSRQALSYHDGITELPSDVLARLMGAVVIHGGSAAAGRLRRTCRFFGRLGGHAAMEQGCRAALAELKGCSEEAVQRHRTPDDEQWMRTAALSFAFLMGREDEHLYLLIVRFVEMRREVQRLPCGDATYADKVNRLENYLTWLRNHHGAEAVALALLAADIRESRELLPDGFRITAVEGGLRVTQESPIPPGGTCTLRIPGMTGTLHDGAVYVFTLRVHQNYPIARPTDGAARHPELFRAQLHPDTSKTLFHPNVYPSGRLCFHGMLDVNRFNNDHFWDASFSLTEVALHIFACLHQMNMMDPCQAIPYESARNDRPAFRRAVREGAVLAKADPPPPLTPVALRNAVLFADPNRQSFRSFELEGRTLRLHWPVQGKWPSFTWPDDVGSDHFPTHYNVMDGQLVDLEPAHFGWL